MSPRRVLVESWAFARQLIESNADQGRNGWESVRVLTSPCVATEGVHRDHDSQLSDQPAEPGSRARCSSAIDGRMVGSARQIRASDLGSRPCRDHSRRSSSRCSPDRRRRRFGRAEGDRRSPKAGYCPHSRNGHAPKAAIDAVHVSMATVHGLNYLLTWNCAHIANAAMRERIEDVCRKHGFKPPVICTPEELTTYEEPS